MKNGLIAGSTVLSLAMIFSGPAVAGNDGDAGHVTIRGKNISPVELTYEKVGEGGIPKNGTVSFLYQASAHIDSHYPTLNNLAEVFKATEMWAENFCRSLNGDKGEKWMAVVPPSIKLDSPAPLKYKMDFTFQCYGR